MALILSGDTGVPASGMPAGSVIQVVYGSTNTPVSNTTQTLADTGITATITPTSATSKILVIVNVNGLYNGGTNGIGTKFSLLRSGSVIQPFNVYTNYTSGGGSLLTATGTNYLDSPASTSALVYKVQFCRPDATTGTLSCQWNNDYSSITLQEIKQ